MADIVWMQSGTGVWEVEVGCEAYLHLLAGGAEVVADPTVKPEPAPVKPAAKAKAAA